MDMDMGIRERECIRTESGVGGEQDVYLQTIAICKQMLKPTSWISNALGERVGVAGAARASQGQPWHLRCICLDPEPHGRFETGVTGRATTHTA